MEALVALSEAGAQRIKTFSGLSLQAMAKGEAGEQAGAGSGSKEETKRLVKCMLAIGEVDDNEPLRVIDADTSKSSSVSPKLLPGKTTVMWESTVEPAWPKQVGNINTCTNVGWERFIKFLLKALKC